MSDIGPNSGDRRIFSVATVAILLAIGIASFFGALLLGAYAPVLRQSGGGGEHAMSRSAVGFAGIVRLASDMGRNPEIIRQQSRWMNAQLVVATPESASIPIGDLLTTRQYKTTLLVLPKWETVADDGHRGWVRIKGLLPRSEPEGVLAPGDDYTIARRDKSVGQLTNAADIPGKIVFAAPKHLQVITSYKPGGSSSTSSTSKAGDDAPLPQKFEPLITDGKGGTVLGRLGNLYILADPDLIDNAGLKDERNAASALMLLDWLNRLHPQSIGFDVTLNGLGGSRNLLELAFGPPFLAVTLSLLAVGLLLGWQAIWRFGAAQQRERAIPFGKAALVENGAALIRKARRARHFGGRYASVIQEQAVQAFGVPARIKGDAITSYLDEIDEHNRFSDLAFAAQEAGDETAMLDAAQALYRWQQEKLGDT